MKKIASYALGCKVNQYESEAIAELFAEKGYEVVGIDEEADVYVINTCTVTNFGDKKSRQLIRRVKRQKEDAIVAVIGCYAQTAPDEIMAVEGVNLVIGTKERAKVVEMVEEYHAENGVQSHVSDIMKERVFERLSVQKMADRTRAYMKIQDGCSQYCSYCIIPYARGPIRSRDPKDVIEEVHHLADNGFQEVVLAGIHVASYGKDRRDTSLLQILKEVHQVEGIKRIRFSSIEPNVVTEEFAQTMADLPKVCHHFHLSLQSGCDKTLKEMNRKYDIATYKKATETLRKYMPDVALTTDIIVGFPGELEEDFATTFDFAKEIGFAKIHVFPYSPKKGTPAAERKDQLPNAVKTERSHKLLALSEEMAVAFMEGQIGTETEVLVEKQVSEGVYEGHTSNYIKVHFTSDISLENQIVSVKLLEVSGEIVGGARKL
ncbi:tRNA (N(6)-L-threonylcarbamoyladenosine(37)-C(2))-methylthiotransferase MtaB [Chakrabartyella piscis]|uniref:tRNA (N(6)-L-threonylcarbamoyladenosine(37)-C(2))- methylthiotransferase MtaB n=1 Tax=Chakrabartyella piscis TaxID=2918914 RepID=UPI002958CE97|nr:tRNA (N(6)-L-threonylcarbamoyladenosine(37)-C(2))-methylthiotransferase MtaB [Chakrabartyella piscis]